MIREIPLTRGFVAIVDDEDYERVAALKWGALKACGNREQVYAQNYKRIGSKVVALSMHRFIMGNPLGLIVDHIDRNGLNNTRANLRVCTRSENSRNCKPYRRSKSKSRFKGLVFHKNGRIEARICSHGVTTHIGSFACEEEAARAYDAAALRIHGEFARLNFPREAA